MTGETEGSSMMPRYLVIATIPKQTAEVEALTPDDALRDAINKAIDNPLELIEGATWEVRPDDF